MSDLIFNGNGQKTFVFANGGNKNNIFSSYNDPNAMNYIRNLEAIEGSFMESSFINAVNDFVIGCKKDNLWSKIRGCGLLIGAKTLKGALLPLKGNYNITDGFGFNSSGYYRNSGLFGNGTNQYLELITNHNIDPIYNHHLVTYITKLSTINGNYIGAAYSLADGQSRLATNGFASSHHWENFSPGFHTTGFFGISRTGVSFFNLRYSGNNYQYTRSAQTPLNSNYFLFKDSSNNLTNMTNGGLSFYSFGSGLNLSLYNERVNIFMEDIKNANLN